MKKILLVGYYGLKNTGDDAMLWAVLKGLKAKYPDDFYSVSTHETVCLSSEISENVRFVRRTPCAIIKEIFSSSIIIWGGGTIIFQIHKSFFSASKILLRLYVLFLFCKLFRKKIFLLGIGVTSLTSWWSRFLAKGICKFADYITIRDSQSKKILADIGIEDDKVIETFDFSILLIPNIEEADKKIINKSNISLGLSILPFYTIYEKNPKKDEKFIEQIAETINQILNEHHKLSIKLFIFHGKTKDHDEDMTESLFRKIIWKNRAEIIPYNPNPHITLEQVSQCHAFIGMRLHASIFAYITKVPLLMINYHPKCIAFAKDIGLPNHAIISMDEIMKGGIGMYLRELLDNPSIFTASLSLKEAQKKAWKSFEQIHNFSENKL